MGLGVSGKLAVPFCWWEAVGFQGGLDGEGRDKMGVVRSLNVEVSTQQEGGEAGSGTSRWLLSSTFFISTPSTLPLSWECRIVIPDLLCLSAMCSRQRLLGQGNQHRKFAQMQQLQSALTLCAPLSFSVASGEGHG